MSQRFFRDLSSENSTVLILRYYHTVPTHFHATDRHGHVLDTRWQNRHQLTSPHKRRLERTEKDPSSCLNLASNSWRRSVWKAHLHIQVNLTYVKIGDHVSNNLSGRASDREQIALVQNFPALKLEWIE